MITTILTILNTIILLGIVAVWFQRNYVIMDKQSWDILEQFVEEHKDDDSNQEVTELPGGSGFFREYIDEDEEEE